jgi:hypothetical protein
MRKYFLVSLRLLERIRVGSFNQFNRLQRFASVVVLTAALVLMSQQVQAFDISTEISNCFSGGCDPTRAEVIQSFTNRVEEVSEVIESVDWEQALEYYSNPTSAYRALWGEIADVVDTALGGVISRNFGHVTNKWELRSALESQGIVIYGLEISQDEYIQATRATAASVATSNPAPLIEYFLDFAVRSVTEMGSNLERAIESTPERLQGQYTGELQQLRGMLKPEFIATALATYVFTGKVPQVSFNIDLSKADVRFGILTYSRGERYPGGVLRRCATFS